MQSVGESATSMLGPMSALLLPVWSDCHTSYTGWPRTRSLTGSGLHVVALSDVIGPVPLTATDL